MKMEAPSTTLETSNNQRGPNNAGRETSSTTITNPPTAISDPIITNNNPPPLQINQVPVTNNPPPPATLTTNAPPPTTNAPAATNVPPPLTNAPKATEPPNNTSILLNLSGELYTKHPLEHTWVLWYFKQEKGKEWSEGQKRVASVDTAEDFWALYNYIQPASCINLGCDYSFFKEGIFPMWEDIQNKKGGRWIVNMDKRLRATELDHFWLETLLAVVGEAFDEYSDEICGVVVNIRGKADKLALWTRNCDPIEATMDIGKIFKNRLQISKEVCIDYQPHHASAVKAGSMSKALYYL